MINMKMKMKNKWHRYDINWPGARHRHKYTKHSRIMTMLACNKQHLSNTWSSIHEKVKQHWNRV